MIDQWLRGYLYTIYLALNHAQLIPLVASDTTTYFIFLDSTERPAAGGSRLSTSASRSGSAY